MHKYTRYFHLLFPCFICMQPNIRVLLHIQMKYTTVLSIAGSDCSGGAGIQADIKTISALGCYAASIVTAVTVQNTCGVKNVYPIPAQIVKEQIQAVTEDMQIDALKIGMVTDEGIIAVIADFLSSNRLPAVFDPVLVSSSGYKTRSIACHARPPNPPLYFSDPQPAGSRNTVRYPNPEHRRYGKRRTAYPYLRLSVRINKRRTFGRGRYDGYSGLRQYSGRHSPLPLRQNKLC